MPVLNMDRYYYLDTPRFEGQVNIEHRPHTSCWNARDFYNDPVEYYYLDFKNGNAFDHYPLNMVLTEEEIQKVKDKKVILCLNNSHEAYHHIVEPLYQSLVLKQGIPADNILLISESADIHNEIERVAAKYNQPQFKAEWITQFEWNIQTSKKINIGNGIPQVKTLELKHYDKKYLCFNRRWRLHRVILVAMLQATGTLHKGYVSLGRADDNQHWDTLFGYLTDLFPVDTEIGRLLVANQHSIKGLPDLYLDTDNLIENQPYLSESTHPYYNNSYFSIVNETNFFNSEVNSVFEYSRFLSEKTFKPVAEKHPFIMCSVPNMLDKFRELGYQSFSPYIDESYDKELDDNGRMMMIVREINRLSNLSVQELSNFLKGVRPICEYNYHVLMNKQVFHRKLNY